MKSEIHFIHRLMTAWLYPDITIIPLFFITYLSSVFSNYVIKRFIYINIIESFIPMNIFVNFSKAVELPSSIKFIFLKMILYIRNLICFPTNVDIFISNSIHKIPTFLHQSFIIFWENLMWLLNIFVCVNFFFCFMFINSFAICFIYHASFYGLFFCYISEEAS